jgi:hypothetical protein
VSALDGPYGPEWRVWLRPRERPAGSFEVVCGKHDESGRYVCGGVMATHGPDERTNPVDRWVRFLPGSRPSWQTSWHGIDNVDHYTAGLWIRGSHVRKRERALGYADADPRCGNPEVAAVGPSATGSSTSASPPA